MTVSERNESVEALNNWLTEYRAMTSRDDDSLGFLRGLDNQVRQLRQPRYQQKRQQQQQQQQQQQPQQQPQGDATINSSTNDTVMFDDFARWFRHIFYPELHNRVGIRLMDYSLFSSLLANRADPRRSMDKKMDKKTFPKKLPYQKDLLHPADLLTDDHSFTIGIDDPFFRASSLPTMPKPLLTRKESFCSHDGSESEESANNQPNSPHIIKKSKKYFTWM